MTRRQVDEEDCFNGVRKSSSHGNRENGTLAAMIGPPLTSSAGGTAYK
jgi:hypothetical protein